MEESCKKGGFPAQCWWFAGITRFVQWSEWFTGAFNDRHTPAAPTGLTATPNCPSQWILHWTNLANNQDGFYVAEYWVERDQWFEWQINDPYAIGAIRDYRATRAQGLAPPVLCLRRSMG